MRPSGSIFYSLLYLNSQRRHSRRKHLNPVIWSNDGKTTRQYKKSAIYPFVDGQSAISPSLGGCWIPRFPGFHFCCISLFPRCGNFRDMAVSRMCHVPCDSFRDVVISSMWPQPGCIFRANGRDLFRQISFDGTNLSWREPHPGGCKIQAEEKSGRKLNPGGN